MNEAKYSTNVKYLVSGFELQSTVRGDSDLKSHLSELAELLASLSKIHAAPTKNKPLEAPPTNTADIEVPTCAGCGTSAHMELIQFQQNGNPKRAWKCQECQKWHYDKKKGEKK